MDRCLDTMSYFLTKSLTFDGFRGDASGEESGAVETEDNEIEDRDSFETDLGKNLNLDLQLYKLLIIFNLKVKRKVVEAGGDF